MLLYALIYILVNLCMVETRGTKAKNTAAASTINMVEQNAQQLLLQQTIALEESAC